MQPAVLLLLATSAHAQTFQYGPLQSQLLTACIPAAGRTTTPAAILFHPGGWANGGRNDELSQCNTLAANNIAAFTVDYRLASRTENHWPAQLADAQLAVRWVRSNIGQFNIAPTRICAYGFSAGAQLAMMLGTLAATESTDMSSVLPQYSSQASCSVTVSAPTDLVKLALADRAMVLNLAGPGTAAFQSAQEQDASPVYRLSAQSSPNLLIHGTADPAVPFAEATEMAQAEIGMGLTAFFMPNDGGHIEQGLTVGQKAFIEREAIKFINQY